MAKSAKKSARKAGARKTARKANKLPAPAQASRSRESIPASIIAYNAAQSAGDRRICDTLAQVIDRQLLAESGVECKIWHRHPVWFQDGNPIVGYHKLKDCVRLMFWSGRSFDEPGLAPEGGFQTAGARYTAVDQIAASDVTRWLAKSIAIQWDYKNIVKRKGKLERLK